MGLLYVDTLEPQSGTTLTVGETGQNTVVGGNTMKLNTLQDAGGNAIFTSDGSGNLSSSIRRTAGMRDAPPVRSTI